VLEVLKEDLKKLGILFIILFGIFLVLFRKENFFINLRTIFAIFWIFVLPGFFISYMLNLNFAERTVIGCAISAAIIGISAYFLGLMGINLLYTFIILPLIMIGIGISLIIRKK
jgi:hypothetical protein